MIRLFVLRVARIVAVDSAENGQFSQLVSNCHVANFFPLHSAGLPLLYEASLIDLEWPRRKRILQMQSRRTLVHQCFAFLHLKGRFGWRARAGACTLLIACIPQVWQANQEADRICPQSKRLPNNLMNLEPMVIFRVLDVQRGVGE